MTSLVTEAMIQQLKIDNEALRTKLGEVERERDEADKRWTSEMASLAMAWNRRCDELIDGIKHALTMLTIANESGLPIEGIRQLNAHLMGTITDGNGHAMMTECDVLYRDSAALSAKLAAVREALSALTFSQTEGRDGKMIGWLMLRPDADKGRGGVNVTFTEPEMLAALQAWQDEKEAAIADAVKDS